MNKLFLILLFLAMSAFVIFAVYWGKRMNYAFMYEKLVIETIRETVKEESLIKESEE